MSGHARIHPFSPDDIVSPVTPPQQPATAPLQSMVPLEPQEEVQSLTQAEDPHVRHMQLVDLPRAQPSAEAEQPYIRRVQLVDGPGIDELADLPLPWVRPPTPPPRNPKRFTMKVHPPEDHTPLEVYQSQIIPIRPSVSVSSNTSDTSLYSRNTDGRSIRETTHGGGREKDIPQTPIIRKPVGSGWYRTMPPLVERKSGDHVAFQLDGDSDVGRSLTAPQQTQERSISAPVRASATDDVFVYYSDSSVHIYDVQELDITGMESDCVAPLRLSTSDSQPTAVKKRGNTPVPILGVPAAPPPGGRGNRLYEVQ